MPPLTHVHRIVLVGFMGAGKTTVGPLVAQLLGWSFRDLDEAIEAATGRPVPELLDEGPDAFREIESSVGKELLEGRRVVVAMGGGWPTRAGHMDGLTGESVAVWLEVSPETAVARVSTADVRRPLLEVPDPVGRARRLLSDRIPHYARSGIRIETDGRSAEAVAREVVERVASMSDEPRTQP